MQHESPIFLKAVPFTVTFATHNTMVPPLERGGTRHAQPIMQLINWA